MFHPEIRPHDVSESVSDQSNKDKTLTCMLALRTGPYMGVQRVPLPHSTAQPCVLDSK